MRVSEYRALVAARSEANHRMWLAINDLSRVRGEIMVLRYQVQESPGLQSRLDSLLASEPGLVVARTEAMDIHARLREALSGIVEDDCELAS